MKLTIYNEVTQCQDVIQTCKSIIEQSFWFLPLSLSIGVIDNPNLSFYHTNNANAYVAAYYVPLQKKNRFAVVLNTEHIPTVSANSLEDTILHEFLHTIAYQFHDTGHGNLWRMFAWYINCIHHRHITIVGKD